MHLKQSSIFLRRQWWGNYSNDKKENKKRRKKEKREHILVPYISVWQDHLPIFHNKSLTIRLTSHIISNIIYNFNNMIYNFQAHTIVLSLSLSQMPKKIRTEIPYIRTMKLWSGEKKTKDMLSYILRGIIWM